jgi:hypothetical protein
VIDRPDLDPADFAARVAVRERLRVIRRERKLSCRALCELAGWSRWTVDHLEHAENWGVRRIQAWSRALDHRFRMTIAGLVVPDDDNLDAELLRVATPFGALDADNLHTQAIVLDLARVRVAKGIGYSALGAHIGAGDRAVRGWEDKPTRCYVKTIQRYARGLGGSLVLEVVPVAVAVSA